MTVGTGELGSALTGPVQFGPTGRERPMGPEDAEGGVEGAAAPDTTQEPAPQLEPISSVNPQRPTERREAVAVAKQTVAATRQRQKAASG